MPEKKQVLFLCVHNSARSILAEYLTNHFWGDRFCANSAGLEARAVNLHALSVLREIGIDVSGARSKPATEFRGMQFDLVVTVCTPSEGRCPAWLGAGKKVHLAFQDPSLLEGDAAMVRAHFRALRDEMKRRLPTALNAA